MIRAELSFKSVHRMAKRCRHHSRIGYDHVEWLTLCDESFGAGAHALEIRKIEFNQLESSTVCVGIFPHLLGRRFSFSQIACCADNFRSMRHESTCSFHTKSG